MKKWMRLSLVALVGAALILSVTACDKLREILKDKPVYTSEDFLEIAEDNEYVVSDEEKKDAMLDSPDIFADDFTFADSSLTDAASFILLEKDTTIVGFAEFSSTSDAESYFRQKETDLEDLFEPRSKMTQDVMNYESVESQGEENFFYLIRVEDTILFVAGEPSNYKDVKSFLEAIEYK